MSDYQAWRSRLSEANDPRFWPIEYIDELLADGTAQFWGTDKAALVTQIVTYPGGAVTLKSIAGAGDLTELVEEIEPLVNAKAREAGLVNMKIVGRPGWERAFKARGWKMHQVILIKELGDG